MARFIRDMKVGFNEMNIMPEGKLLKGSVNAKHIC